jgi:hypothetical protein
MKAPEATYTNGRYEPPRAARGVLVLADPPESGWRIETSSDELTLQGGGPNPRAASPPRNGDLRHRREGSRGRGGEVRQRSGHSAAADQSERTKAADAEPHRQVSVKPTVIYTPIGGTPSTRSTNIRLKKL